MQNSQNNGKKNLGRKGASYESNALPSLQLLEKQNNYTTTMQKITSAVASYVESKAETFFKRPPSPPKPVVAVQAKIDAINELFKQLAIKINALDAELKAILEKIKTLRDAKQDVPPELKEEKYRLYEQIDLLKLQQVEAVAENIREHSARRIDLFFLLLIGIYKQNVSYQKGRTGVQHGRGNEETMTAGCHSSLFPCLEFELIPPAAAANSASTYTSYLTDNPVTRTVWSYATDNRIVNTASSFFQTTKPKYFPPDGKLFAGMHFEQVLNITMQLPVCVNQFDMHLEKRGTDPSALVKIAESIIDRTSRGLIYPTQGLDEFCDAYYSMLNSLHTEYVKPGISYKSKGTRGEWPQTFGKILEYQAEGAARIMRFYDVKETNGNETKITKHAAATWEYIYTKLELHKLDISEKAKIYVFSGPIEKRIFDIQEEMLKWKYDPKNELYKESLKNNTPYP